MTSARLLLAEDNAGDVLLLKEALRTTAWDPTVIHLSDGKGVLDYLRHCGEPAQDPWPDLLVMDLNLPSLSGREVLAAIRADQRLASLPVIVFSGSAWERELLTALGLPEKQYLVKPDTFAGFQEAAARMEALWRTAGG